MRLIVLIISLALIGAFVTLNWEFLVSLHVIHLGFASYEGTPVGIILLGLVLIPMLIFYFWAGMAHLRAEANTAKLLRDIESLRTSLDRQEGTRFTELQVYLDEQFTAMHGSGVSSDLKTLQARVDDIQHDINLQLAQMDDYLKEKLK